MILTNVVPDDTMEVTGFERHTFTCWECQDVEERLLFTERRGDAIEPMPEQVAPPVVPASTAQDEPVAASGLLTRVVAKIRGH